MIALICWLIALVIFLCVWSTLDPDTPEKRESDISAFDQFMKEYRERKRPR